jgi:23S rRNA (adenine2503-C2)-methyltransferase
MTMEKENLKGVPLPLLEARMEAVGQPAFRARQLFRWIYSERQEDFSQMTDLSKAFRQELIEKYELPKLEVETKQQSVDGTIKYLVRLPDGQKVESVYIPMEDRTTLCVSTQVGCKMGCTFCATAYQGFTRNLKSWEIVEQLIGIETPTPVTNIVLMGMGEPLDNYEEVTKALQIIQDPRGPKIGKRHITLSTVGLAKKMPDFVDANLGNLAISLHGTTDEQRGKIMPVNRKYPLAVLMETCRNLKFKGQRRVTFEYILIKDFNDSDEDARRLVKLVSGLPCKINLLAYNENPYIDLKRPSEERVLAFQNILLEKHLTATYRRSRGRDIAAACGQLKTQEAVN